MHGLIPSLWYCYSSAPDTPAPAPSTTNPSQQSARDDMTFDLFPHCPLLDVSGAHDQATTMRRFAEWADIFPSLLLFHNQPLPFNAPRVPAIILLPWGFSCCCKLPAHDHAPVVGLLVFSIAHGYTPAERLELLLLRLLLPCPRPVQRPVPTGPTVMLPPRPRLPHLLPSATLVPARLSVGGNTSSSPPQLSSSERSDDGGAAFVPAAPGVGCVSLPPNSLPTIMLPS